MVLSSLEYGQAVILPILLMDVRVNFRGAQQQNGYLYR